jgi:hypothetical protein
MAKRDHRNEQRGQQFHWVVGVLIGLVISSCGVSTGFIGLTESKEVGHSIDGAVQSLGQAPAIFDPNRDFAFIEKQMDSAKREPVSTSMNLSSSQIQDEIVMTSDYTDEVIAKTQVSRPMIVDSFKQGTQGLTVTESLSQVSSKSGPLDILIVMDNSRSMVEEQENIATKLQDLLAHVANADWRIAVVTTDPNDGCQRALIKKGDSNASASFATAVRPGTAGSASERGILMSVVGLRGSFPSGVSGGTCSLSAPWLRPNAPVAVLIVSDEDNCSNGRDCGAAAWGEEKYLRDYLSTIRQPGVDAKVYGIIYHPTQARSDCQSGLSPGAQYASIIQQTNGLWGSVCATDYGNILRRISEDAATLLKHQYTLKNIPDLSSAQIKINGAAVASGWTIKDQTLTFTAAPPPGASIDIRYTVGARPIKSRFKLTASPAMDTLKVMENGSVLAPQKYAYDSATNELVYTAADNADVRVDYRQQTPALVSVFDLGAGVHAATLDVKVNGVVAKNYSLSSDNKTLIFAVPPADGAQILFTLKRFKSKRLAYPYTLPSGLVGGTYEVRYLATGAKIPVIIGNGLLTITEPQHIEGQKLAVIYRVVKPANGWELPLASVPDQGSLRVKAGSIECAPSTFSVVSGKLLLKCDTGGMDRVDVSYTHTQPSLSLVDFPEVAGKSGIEWAITINQKPVVAGEDFRVEGTKIYFLKSHLPSSKVKIVAKYLKD